MRVVQCNELDRIVRDGYRLNSRIEQCMKAPVIVQRSKEWFDARRTRITGSIVDTLLGTNPFGNYDDLVCEKADMPVEFKGNEATAHGIKYEPEAIAKYMQHTGRQVVEMGLTEHHSCPLLAHSPDGISLSIDSDPILLEVKCPLRRIIKGGIVPKYYMGQLQMGMNLFDVSSAHFVQYKPADEFGNEIFDLTIVCREEGWLDKHMPKFQKFWDDVQHYKKIGWQNHPKYSQKAEYEFLRHHCLA